jgi:glucosamine--fructose-6-phosphate aminotransferase (isomerizing)
MKEMTRSWTEVYHTLEFRHGPMSVVTRDALVIGFISDFAADAELKVLSDMKNLGARTLVICDTASKLDLTNIDEVVEINSGLNDWERAILYLPFLQKTAFYRSLAKGLNPDEPVNLSQVVTLS